jgi:hypothetical protein
MPRRPSEIAGQQILLHEFKKMLSYTRVIYLEVRSLCELQVGDLMADNPTIANIQAA